MVKEGTANAKAWRPERLCVFYDQTGCVCVDITPIVTGRHQSGFSAPSVQN